MGEGLVEEAKAAVKIQDLTVAYDGRPVLWQISASIPAGKIVGVIGPNGAGKSTLLKAVMGLIPSVGGKIVCNHQAIAYIPQRSAIDWDFPITVLEVVTMGAFSRRGLFGRVSVEDKKKIQKAMEDLGLLSLAHRQIS
jgi:manganese/zinc/iron transport system ATP- binding protein